MSNPGSTKNSGASNPSPPSVPTLGNLCQLRQHHESRFGTLDKRFETLETKLESAFASVVARLDALAPSSQSPVNVPPSLPPQVVSTAPPAVRDPKIITPKPFEGDFELCRGFLVQCELVFQHQPSRYGSDGAKIAFVLSLLSGRALRWATAAVGQSSRLSSTYSAFRAEFKSVFDHPEDGEDAATRLHSIQQGSRSVADYTLEFRILAADSKWGDKALQSAYRRGLSEAVKDGLLRDRPSSYNELIELALLMDQRLRERRAERAHRTPNTNQRSAVVEARVSSSQAPVSSSPTYPASAAPAALEAEEPMQLGRSRLSAGERERRFQQRLCLYCGQGGHVIRDCGTRPKDKAL